MCTEFITTVEGKNFSIHGQKCKNKCCGEFSFKNVKFSPKKNLLPPSSSCCKNEKSNQSYVFP